MKIVKIIPPLLTILALAACGLITSVDTQSVASPTPGGPRPEQTQAVAPLPTTGAAQGPYIPAPTPGVPQPLQTQNVAPPPPAPSAIELRQLTSGGCCVQPFFSPDSRMVLFIDRPDASAPAGLYGVPVEDGTTTLITERLGVFSADLSLRAFPSGGGAVIERLSDGQRWTVANGGREVSFSPDNAWVAWTSGQTGTNLDAARRQVWAAKTDGSAAHVVVEVTGGGFSGWLPDGRLLVTARLPGGDTGLFAALPGARTEALPELPLASGQRLRSLAVSPSGRWLAMLVTFSSDPAEDGVWVVDLQNGDRRKIEPFGAYRWRGDQLLLAPFEPGAASHRLLQIDPTTGLATAITDPALMPFKIANGDWRVSPDGRWMVFVSAQDQNLWLVKLPD